MALDKNVKKMTFGVVGLDCAVESRLLKDAIEERPGVSHLEFDLLQGKMMVYVFENIGQSTVIEWVKGIQMEAYPWSERERKQKASVWGKYGRLLMVLCSGIFLLAGVACHHLLSPAVAERLYFFAIAFGAYFVFPKAFYALKRLMPDMNLLMVMAISGAIAIGQWFEGASVSFLFAIALLLESWSVEKARLAITALMDLKPSKARVVTESGLKELGVNEVKAGALILVKPGEKIPLDAIVEKGISSVDQAPITGESRLVVKEQGAELFAGTINHEGALVCRVTKEVQETTLARMIELVEEAQAKRSRSEQWVEKFARVYTPIMMILAFLIACAPPLLMGGAWESWIYRALVILVIACPCALVISTPVTVVSGLAAAARQGVLIKGGNFLEAASQLKALAFDKTGTLTYGKPKVERVIPLNGHTEEQLLEKAAALEAASEHPIAHAIIMAAKERKIRIRHAERYQVTKGKGAEGYVDGERYWVGSHRFMNEMGQETAEIHEIALGLEDAGHSILAIGSDRHVCGLISVSDTPRNGIKRTLKEVKRVGIEELMMLTGDHVPAAEAIATHAGIDTFRAELLPEDKVKVVAALKDKWSHVGMIGDGINDAPAMATASLGIAMGVMGTDVAIETADIALMTDDLSKIPWLVRHSKRVVRTIKENTFFAIGIKIVVFGLAIGGLATLWMAIAADIGTSLVVIFNGLKVLKTRA